ncbi:MAG: hypothetical protein KatS3mg081_0857 [Gemmatimonadales bacterium]|nr:MAG: hypothetical protein KatS3mg081_0857 [Gemmatimonadales bacterium]
MSISKTFLVGAAAAGLLLVWRGKDSTVGAETVCFACTDGWDPWSGWVTHIDFFWFDNNVLHGVKHPRETRGGCDHWEHFWYGPQGPGDDPGAI